MAKQLYLFRHAEAVEKSSERPDKERQLTKKGIQQAEETGEFIVSKKIQLDAVFCSTAVRTFETAKYALQKVKFPTSNLFYDDDLYEGSTKRLLDIINQISDDYNVVMIIGHNPEISTFTGFITNDTGIQMDLAAIALIEFQQASWAEINRHSGELKLYAKPKE